MLVEEIKVPVYSFCPGFSSLGFIVPTAVPGQMYEALVFCRQLYVFFLLRHRTSPVLSLVVFVFD